MKNKTPKVTITLPVFNLAQYLPKAIESALRQSLSDFELIMVNDASDDSSLKVAKEYSKKDSRIKVLSNEKNLGTYVSRNKAMQVSRGEYIVNLDADDFYEETKLEKQAAILDHHQDLAGCIHPFRQIDPPNDRECILHRAPNTLMFRRTLLNEIGFYDSVRFSGDQEYLGRILQVYGPKSIVMLSEVLQTNLFRTDSLMHHPETSVVSPRRSRYLKRFQHWHKIAAKDELYMAFPQEARPFDLGDGEGL